MRDRTRERYKKREERAIKRVDQRPPAPTYASPHPHTQVIGKDALRERGVQEGNGKRGGGGGERERPIAVTLSGGVTELDIDAVCLTFLIGADLVLQAVEVSHSIRHVT